MPCGTPGKIAVHSLSSLAFSTSSAPRLPSRSAYGRAMVNRSTAIYRYSPGQFAPSNHHDDIALIEGSAHFGRHCFILLPPTPLNIPVTTGQRKGLFGPQQKATSHNIRHLSDVLDQQRPFTVDTLLGAYRAALTGRASSARHGTNAL
jgi:hypothetical protein